MGTEATIARFAGFRQMSFDRLTVPEPKRGQVVVRMRYACVCGSDLHVFSDRDFWDRVRAGEEEIPPAGHETVAVVVDVGEDVDLKVGDRVIPWYEPGNKNPDAKPTGFSEYALLEAVDCVPVAAEIPDLVASLVEIASCGLLAVEEAALTPGNIPVVVGTGALAQMAVAFASEKCPSEVIVVGRRQSALDRMMALFPRIVAVNSHTEAPLDVVRDITGREGADVVIETGGTQGAIDLAAKLARPSTADDYEDGRLVLAGLHRFGMRGVGLGDLAGRGAKLENAHWRRRDEKLPAMAAVVRLLEHGRFVELFERMRVQVFPFDEIDEAFEAALNRELNLTRAIVQIG